ncbi:RNA polymerase sigma factor [Clostridia bacterium]|nr:RNA polymerase sigma factor [Clostridia bacterium]
MFSIILLLQVVAIRLRLSGNGGPFKRPLSSEEERAAIGRMRAGDEAARDMLIEHNLRLVAHVMKRYYVSAADQDDLLSIGTIGLIKGVNTYNPDKNIKLASYAGRCIENEIKMYFRKVQNRSEVSLHDPLGQEGDEMELLDILSLEAAPDAPDELMEIKELRALVRALVDTLSGREREIIMSRYGFRGSPMTQKEVAAKLGISRSYVSRLETKALAGLGELYRQCNQ